MNPAARALSLGPWRGATRNWPPHAPTLIALLVCLGVLSPLAVTVYAALAGGLAHALHLLLRPIVAQLLLNTVGLALVTTLASGILGVGVAWLVERSDLPGRRLWSVAAPLPLAIPAFIASYAWLSTSVAFEGAAGAALVVTASYYPLVYLPVAAALRNMDPALEESARTMGCTPWRVFWRVVLPQLRPALLGGMLLVILHVLAEFGAFSLLHFRTFTTAIYAEYTAGFAPDLGAMLACVLLVLCLFFLLLEARLRGRSSYARTGPGARRPPLRYTLGPMRYLALSILAAVFVITLGVPLATIAYWLTQHDAAAVTTASIAPARILSATLHSLGYGLLAGIATTVLAIPVAYLATRFRQTFVQLIERATYLPRGMPGIVVGLALVTVSLRLLYPLYQSTGLLIAGYAIMFMPLALVSVRSSLEQVPVRLEQSARVLGSTPLESLRRVVLPLAAPGLGAAAALVFISTCTELTSTLLLAPTGAQTLATQVWAASSTFAFASAAPYAALLVGISMLATWILANRFGRAPAEAS
ncbi:MAG TPA: iron ABC transporter permease [Nevskiaceae bacterium]|nr:iron ABC transporter permease [Nevskiaceae bacterium]